MNSIGEVAQKLNAIRARGQRFIENNFGECFRVSSLSPAGDRACDLDEDFLKMRTSGKLQIDESAATPAAVRLEAGEEIEH